MATVRRRIDALTEFIRTDVASGIMMLGAIVMALVLANSAWADRYFEILHHELGPDGTLQLSMSVQEWITTLPTTLFFFVVGLELKRELVTGELRDRRTAMLPAVAALAGMAVPALIYLAINAGGDGARGWGVPMATEVAFALGVLALFGPRVPRPLKLFLLTLAIVDDLGTIIVIAIGYGQGLRAAWFVLAAGAVALVFAMQRLRIGSSFAYVIPAALLWLALNAGGISPSLAGAVLGLLTPAHPFGGRSVIDQLEHQLHPWSAFVVVPVFALANAGVRLTHDVLDAAMRSRIVWGIIIGRVLGKFIGITVITAIARHLGLRSNSVNGADVRAIGALAGIGFTVALVVANLAFRGTQLELARVGILAGMALSSIIGAGLLRFAIKDRA